MDLLENIHSSNLRTTVDILMSDINGKVFATGKARRPARSISIIQLSGERLED